MEGSVHALAIATPDALRQSVLCTSGYRRVVSRRALALTLGYAVVMTALRGTVAKEARHPGTPVGLSEMTSGVHYFSVTNLGFRADTSNVMKAAHRLQPGYEERKLER